MPSKIAKFEKIAREYYDEVVDEHEGVVFTEYDDIKLPKRSTKDAAGYDFYLPTNIGLKPGEAVTIPTFIKAKIDPSWVLLLFPRSGLGFKYNMRLANTIGVVDSDYYEADNGGHIWIKIVNDGMQDILLRQGDRFAQGVFVPYGITEDDDCDNKEVRVGGFGSTDNETSTAPIQP